MNISFHLGQLCSDAGWFHLGQLCSAVGWNPKGLKQEKYGNILLQNGILQIRSGHRLSCFRSWSHEAVSVSRPVPLLFLEYENGRLKNGNGTRMGQDFSVPFSALAE
jgi:hypothetical protein